MSVKTRFAPSPTGFLHIGGARTALFNWLFARHHNGEFLLRIEDTDRERSNQAAVDAILDGLDWLGLKPDQAPVYQSKQIERHVEVARALLDKGAAFKCYTTQEELAERREKGQVLLQEIKSGSFSEEELSTKKAEANEILGPFRSPYRDGVSPSDGRLEYTVRLRAPDDKSLVLSDGVQGHVTVKSQEIDDLILLRADGTPTYMLAVVVDDHDMGITQVIRGDDHLTNTFRQLPIYQGMGWTAPNYAHVPLIHGPDGKKLSKRHGALGVDAYRDMGYIPEGLNNYLLRLGWAHADDEFIQTEDAIRLFDVGGLNKAPARLDFDKMRAINAQHIQTLPLEKLYNLVLQNIVSQKSITEEQKSRLNMAISTLSERGQTIPDIADAAEFLLSERPLKLNAKARKKLKGDALSRLENLQSIFETLDSWCLESIDNAIAAFCTENDLSIGQIGPALRMAITGGLPAPDLNKTVFWLGKNEVVGRIQDALASSTDT